MSLYPLFDEYGAVAAEWSLDEGDLGSDVASCSTLAAVPDDYIWGLASSSDVIQGRAADSRYSRTWKYFSSAEEDARVNRDGLRLFLQRTLMKNKMSMMNPSGIMQREAVTFNTKGIVGAYVEDYFRHLSEKRQMVYKLF